MGNVRDGICSQALSSELPQMMADSLREQVERIKAMSQEMKAIEKRLALQLKEDADMQRIAQILGVGLLTATAAIATTMGDASAFNSGCQFCAWLGLRPRRAARAASCVWGSSPGGVQVHAHLAH